MHKEVVQKQKEAEEDAKIKADAGAGAKPQSLAAKKAKDGDAPAENPNGLTEANQSSIENGVKKPVN